MDRKKLKDAINKALEDKGKKKFTQSVEIIINMRGIDFSKSENRLNLDIVLPKGKGGKEMKAAVFAEDTVGSEAKKGGAELVISPSEIESYKDSKKLKELTRDHFLLAQPSLMGQVAKSLGQMLGKMGKMPRPIVGRVDAVIDRTRKSVRIRSKGKYLPVAQAFVGTESMEVEDILENAEAVYDGVKAKVSEGNIRSVYVKLTMGRSVRAV